MPGRNPLPLSVDLLLDVRRQETERDIATGREQLDGRLGAAHLNIDAEHSARLVIEVLPLPVDAAVGPAVGLI